MILKYIEKVSEEYSKEILAIKKILEDRKFSDNITILKIKEILKLKFDINLSKSTIYRILKNKLKYKYRKTMVKNKDLNNLNYKIISFILLKIVILSMQKNFNFIFIDETNFCLKNNNFKTWIKYDENLNYGPKKKDKLNLILAVSVNRVINYTFTRENINKDNFLIFMEKTISKLNEDEIKTTVFIMDNLSVHLCENIKNLMKMKKLKVLYSVPYESKFNPIELSFRFIKNYTYKKIYFKIKDLEKDVKEILECNSINKALFKNFVETLNHYFNFI